jgi:hypothetical protein
LINFLNFTNQNENFLQFDGIDSEINSNYLGLERNIFLYFKFYLKKGPYVRHSQENIDSVIPLNGIKIICTITTEKTLKKKIIFLDYSEEEWKQGSNITFYKIITLNDIEKLSQFIQGENFSISLLIQGYVLADTLDLKLFEIKINKFDGNNTISNHIFYEKIINKIHLDKTYISEFILNSDLELITSPKLTFILQNFLLYLLDFESTLKTALDRFRKASQTEDYASIMSSIRKKVDSIRGYSTNKLALELYKDSNIITSFPAENTNIAGVEQASKLMESIFKNFSNLFNFISKIEHTLTRNSKDPYEMNPTKNECEYIINISLSTIDYLKKLIKYKLDIVS